MPFFGCPVWSFAGARDFMDKIFGFHWNYGNIRSLLPAIEKPVLDMNDSK